MLILSMRPTRFLLYKSVHCKNGELASILENYDEETSLQLITVPCLIEYFLVILGEFVDFDSHPYHLSWWEKFG